jgi:hypothetical protein
MSETTLPEAVDVRACCGSSERRTVLVSEHVATGADRSLRLMIALVGVAPVGARRPVRARRLVRRVARAARPVRRHGVKRGELRLRVARDAGGR